MLEGYGGFLIPLEFVRLPEKFEKGQASVAESTDETTQGGHAPCKLHQILLAPVWLHESDSIDLCWVGFDSPVAYDEAE